MIETPRLRLRSYREDDREAFFRINSDPRVGDWVGGALDRAGSDALIDRINGHIAEHGFGYWAAEQKVEGRLIGFVGLQTIVPTLPLPPGVEMGWRLSPDAQGQGLASEGASAALAYAFETLGAPRVLAFTARTNLRSLAVMRRIGMRPAPALDFDHPRLAPDHPLLAHVVYEASPAWFAGPRPIG